MKEAYKHHWVMNGQIKMNGELKNHDPFKLSVLYNYVRSRQLEGTYPGSPETGVWPITSKRVMRGWGSVPERAWPYLKSASKWPPDEPPGLDDLAKKKRIGTYQRMRSLSDYKLVLGIHNEVATASLEITDEWYDAPNGRIPKRNRPVIGSHCVLIVGYNDNENELMFQNSWGVKWGEAGYGYIGYDTFQAMWIEGWIGDIRCPDYTFDNPEIARIINWGIPDLLGGIIHVVEIVQENEPIAWSFIIERGEFLDVEEFFVMPKHRRRKHGKNMMESIIRDVAQPRELKIRFWIPHSDTDTANLGIFRKLISHYGFKLKPSHVRWAALEASQGPDIPSASVQIKKLIHPASPFLCRPITKSQT